MACMIPRNAEKILSLSVIVFLCLGQTRRGREAQGIQEEDDRLAERLVVVDDVDDGPTRGRVHGRRRRRWRHVNPLVPACVRGLIEGAPGTR